MLKALVTAVVFAPALLFSQVELTGINDPVYAFLKEMQLSGFLKGYSSSQLPLSGRSVAGHLSEISANRSKLSVSQRERLEYFISKYEYEISGTLLKQDNLLAGKLKSGKGRNVRLYSYADSGVYFHAGILLSSYYRNNSAVQNDFRNVIFGKAAITAGASLFDRVGISLFLPENYGFTADRNASKHIPYFFPDREGKDGFADRSRVQADVNGRRPSQPKDTIFNEFQGYLRYSSDGGWFSLLAGRISQSVGFGYIDKLFLSDNAAPYDKAGIDLHYKAVSYSFSYGSVYGDSVGIYSRSLPYPKYERELTSKNVVNHYLGIRFSDNFRMGLWESVVVSEQPFSFTYLNPLSFLTSADLSSGDESTTNNNSLIGIETEILPLRGLSLQASLLIDDLTFGTLFEDDSLNENKFAWQFGAMWNAMPGLTFSAEYTHLDPFVYSHRSNKSTYTNRENSLGHMLPPNSDEIAVQLRYDPFYYLSACLTYRHQRSGEGVVLNEDGTLKANYGGYISYGLGDAYLRTNNFLDGDRINRDFITLNASLELMRQIFLQSRLEYRRINNLFDGTLHKDFLFDIGFKVDLR